MTAKGYSLAHGLSLRQTFNRSWRDTYDQMPDYNLITKDLDRYMNCGAVPPYVHFFLKKQVPKKKGVLGIPYYALM